MSIDIPEIHGARRPGGRDVERGRRVIEGNSGIACEMVQRAARKHGDLQRRPGRRA